MFEEDDPHHSQQIPARLRSVPITPDMELSKDLGINSAAMVDMVLTVEEMFRLKPIDTDHFEQSQTSWIT